MITFKKNIITLALTGALVGTLSTAAKSQEMQAPITTQAQANITTAELSKFVELDITSFFIWLNSVVVKKYKGWLLSVLLLTWPSTPFDCKK